MSGEPGMFIVYNVCRLSAIKTTIFLYTCMHSDFQQKKLFQWSGTRCIIDLVRRLKCVAMIIIIIVHVVRLQSASKSIVDNLDLCQYIHYSCESGCIKFFSEHACVIIEKIQFGL